MKTQKLLWQKNSCIFISFMIYCDRVFLYTLFTCLEVILLEKLVINGKTRLKGDVTISGAKNAAVAILPATLLIDGVCTIDNLPNISDVRIYCDILQDLGAKITWNNEHEVTIDTREINSYDSPLDKTSKFRASYYLLGSLLGRFGHAQVGMPGGCNLGARPIDQHKISLLCVIFWKNMIPWCCVSSCCLRITEVL